MRSWILIAVAGLAWLPLAAAEEAKKPAPKKPAETKSAPVAAKDQSAEKLALSQQQLADRYHHLEEVLLRMAELTAPTDPRRAALLRKAVGQSKEQLIGLQFEQLVKLLEKDQLSRAIDNQKELHKDLQGLLELLLSENRAKRLESEKARIAQYLKLLNGLIRQQKGLQSRTQSAGDPKSLAPEQKQLADKTGGLAKEIQAKEEARPTPAGQRLDQAKPKPGDSSKGKPGDSKGEGKGKGKPGKGESQGKGQDQNPHEGQAQSPPGEPENPARKRLQAAEERMRQAEKRLEEAKRREAAEEQEEALRELEQAKADLEKILRQLREEEMERVLAVLEARFLKMLKLQRDVLEGTVRLDKVPQERRDHNQEIEAGRLSNKEVEIVVEADKALLLLREEGTAVAFPEALSQARQDMQQVVERLAEAKVGKVTQGLEEDIITALQEMIESLKRAQKKLQERKQRPPIAPAEGKDALVDVLSELKMIRALQVRVNMRTERYSKLLQGEQAESAELVDALTRLAERQQRIYEITRDLETGKNR